MKRLYVGNLSYRATEDELKNFFEQSGVTVNSVNIMRDRYSNEARGFGFVEVSDSDLEHAIQATHGKQMMGRALVVNEARPANKQGGGGGGRPGGGGGGFRGRGGRGGGGGGDREDNRGNW